MVAWPAREPRSHTGMFMSRVVVDDEMQIELRWDACIDVIEEGEEFLMAMASFALRQDFPALDI